MSRQDEAGSSKLPEGILLVHDPSRPPSKSEPASRALPQADDLSPVRPQARARQSGSARECAAGFPQRPENRGPPARFAVPVPGTHNGSPPRSRHVWVNPVRWFPFRDRASSLLRTTGFSKPFCFPGLSRAILSTFQLPRNWIPMDHSVA